MQAVKYPELARRAVRHHVCTECFDRPAGSEALDAMTPRICESTCTIFRNLPRLVQTAATLHRDSLGPYEVAIRDTVCQHCELSPTAGDYCTEGTEMRCPLRRHLGQVLDVLERLDQARRHPRRRKAV